MALLICFLGTKAQNKEFVLDYINTYKQVAIDEMLRTGVPASIKLAQGIHETEAGRSDLVLRSNNHFGIKCKTGWQGEKVYHDDDARGECFRSYGSAQDSYVDHSNFLKNSSRYAFLFELDPTDYKAWAYGLKKAGYATNIKYSQILIRIIEDYNLQQYSLIALGKMRPEEEILAGRTKPVTANREPVKAIPVVMEEPPARTVDYPSGEFTINKTRVVYVKAGTSLLAIAQQYDVSLAKIFDFNDMPQEDVLLQDQLIFLQRKRKTGANEYHVVEKGETLYSISQMEGIRMESLLEYNLLKPGMTPAVGEKLNLQRKADYPPRLQQENTRLESLERDGETNNEALSAILHIVRAKETLYGIAKSYGTTTEKIMEWNKLQGTQLQKGQELIIYKN
jgi:LysM repeat protein